MIEVLFSRKCFSTFPDYNFFIFAISEGLKMDFLQLQYLQFRKTSFSPFKNFKNVIRRPEILESCNFYEKTKKQPLKTFWWLRNQGFTNSQTIPQINPWHLLVHILNEFFFHHKWRKGISNDIKSSWWNFIYICKKT